ncbi:hypothetical protein HDU83_002204 [Entophlyctis luteolus]|nr:hypothetical protein HDU83_002204 [Entophlyctis luteolus]
MPDRSTPIILICIDSIGLAANLIITAFVIGYIIRYDYGKDSRRLGLFHHLKKPFNANLICMGFCLIGIFSGALYDILATSMDYTVTEAVTDVLVAVYEFSLVKGSTSRSLPIITKVFPKIKLHLTRLLVCTPVAILFQVLLAVANAVASATPQLRSAAPYVSSAYQLSELVAGAVVISIDVISLAAFAKYVFDLTRDDENSDAYESDKGGGLKSVATSRPHWNIIVHYGAAASAFALLIFVLYGASLAVPVGSDTSKVLYAVIYCCGTFAVIALCAMKVRVRAVTWANPNCDPSADNAACAAQASSKQLSRGVTIVRK